MRCKVQERRFSRCPRATAAACPVTENGDHSPGRLGADGVLGYIPGMSLAVNVHRLRVTYGQTIEEIADAARLPAALVAAIENGRTAVPPKAIKALAVHFGVSVEVLTAYTNE